MKLNAKELRQLKNTNNIPKIKRLPIYFILENIYDTYNIGGLFRLADALTIKKIYLCGETETPPNQKIKKASIGTDKIVPWEYKKNAKEAIEELKKIYVDENKKHVPITIYAIEQHHNSIPYYQSNYQLPCGLIFGNESFGILPETLKIADQILEIPMFGINKSLNVIVASAIVSYHLILKTLLDKSN